MLDNGKAEGARKIKQIEKYCLRDIAIVSQGFTFSRLYQGKKNLKWNYFKVADIGINPNSKYLRMLSTQLVTLQWKKLVLFLFQRGVLFFHELAQHFLITTKNIGSGWRGR